MLPVQLKKQTPYAFRVLTRGSGIKTYIFRAKLRPKDGRMKQNGGHHAIRRHKLPLESDLPTFFGDPPFLGRYVSYTSVTRRLHE